MVLLGDIYINVANLKVPSWKVTPAWVVAQNCKPWSCALSSSSKGRRLPSRELLLLYPQHPSLFV